MVGHNAALAVLERYWGFSCFRPGQWPLIEASLEGKDALGILPTGAGKSICYQIPALLSDGLTLVISPLIALMEDQTDALSRKGIAVVNFSGSLSPGAYDRLLNNSRYGRVRIIYISPERFLSERFRAQLPTLNVTHLAIDEAHCISEWGHDFRPDYHRIAEVYDGLNRPPVIALTATATPRVRRDIVERLSLEKPVEIVKSFDRPNLSFSVFRSISKREKVKEIFSAVPGSGIVYAPTRRSAERWVRLLGGVGEKAGIYHAGIPKSERSASQQAWLSGATRIMVATSAFGMGVDKSGVRSVVHAGLPLSLEAYYQEAGRAGRDGQKAYAALLFNQSDIEDRRRMLIELYPTLAQVRSVFDTLMSLNAVAVGSEREDDLRVDTGLIQKVTGLESIRIRNIIQFLLREQLLTRSPGFSGEFEEIRLPGVRPSRLIVDRLRRRRLKRRALRQLRDVLEYAADTGCRRQRLVAHFDDFSADRCGMCDNCLGRHSSLLVDLPLNKSMRTILQRIAAGQHLQNPLIVSGAVLPDYRIDEMLDWLSLQGYVELPEDPQQLPGITALGAAVSQDSGDRVPDRTGFAIARDVEDTAEYDPEKTAR